MRDCVTSLAGTVCGTGVYSVPWRAATPASPATDLLVDVPPGVSGFALGALLMDAQDMLGRRVDIVTVAALHPMVRELVLREAQPL